MLPSSKQAVGDVDVRIAGRRAVGSEGAVVAGDRRGHAQARVRVDVVGAEEALGQLVDGVVVLGQQLPGDVDADRARAVLGSDGREPLGHQGDGVVPADRLGSARRASRATADVVARSALWIASGSATGLRADPSGVDGVLDVAANRLQPAVANVGDQTAADPAVRAAGLDAVDLQLVAHRSCMP